jgi:hypothetical protein
MTRITATGAGHVLAALDRFFEAVGPLTLKQSLKRLREQLRVGMARAFLLQGNLLLQYFEYLRSQFAEAAGGGISIEDWGRIFDRVAAETYSEFAFVLDAVTKETLQLSFSVLPSGLHSVASFSSLKTFDLANPRAQAYLAEHGAALVTKINDTTRDELRTLITQARADGWSYNRLADAIKNKFEGFAGLKPQQHIRDRATLVAVTEVGNGYEAGTLMQMQELNTMAPIEKNWITVGDGRVEQVCLDNAAKGWIPVDKAFPSGHMRPLAHPACRCSMGSRVNPEWLNAQD